MRLQTAFDHLARCGLGHAPVCRAVCCPRRPWRPVWGPSLHRAKQQLPHRFRCSATAAPAAERTEESSTEPEPVPSFQAFLDWKSIRSDLQKHKDNVAARNSSADPEKAVALYDSWRQLDDETNRVRNERNLNAKSMKGNMEPERRTELVDQGKKLKDQLASLEADLSQAQDAMQREGQRLPNLAHPEAPIGSEEDARVVELVGSKPELGSSLRDHLQLGKELDLLDFEAAAVTSGSKFAYLKRAAALLELALCNWAMVQMHQRGFVPVSTPDLVQAAVLEKCGFQPRGSNTQVYAVQDSSLCLTGTAEVPLGAMYMDQTLTEEQLPLKLAGFGHCFRTEAGAAGAASKGLYRLHQFSKVEMFVLCTPQQSESLLQELCDIERDLFTQLGLHFQILDMPTGDLGAPAYRKYDIEAWMPGLARFGEISSASNCTDYQSRRLNIRYKPSVAADEQANGKPAKPAKVPAVFVHTLNATACAVPRMILAILENFQREDGTVAIPEPLQPYMGGMTSIEP